MCGGGSAPSPPPKLPEAARPPDVNIQKRVTDAERRRRSAGGTILTSPQGVTQGAATSERTVLGT